MKLDLHIHTTASDGAWSPEEVVGAAADRGLDVIAVTDHDSVAGVDRARAAARGRNLEVLSGIEISSTADGRDVHVLGYRIDVDAPPLTRYAVRAERRREARMREMLERLSDQGVEIPYRDVERAAGPDRGVIGRPHLARALVEAGHATSIPDAFNHLIGDQSDAFVPTHMLDPAGAIDLIIEAGGVPVWAHPPADLIEPHLPGMLEAGLRGLEVYRPRNRRSDMARLEQLCGSRDLFMTGGSDWHSPDSGTLLGDFHVEARDIEAFLEAVGL